MCSQVAEGVHHRPCAHFITHYFPASIKDCGSPTCTKSCKHPPNCYSPHCTREWGPRVQKCNALYYTLCENCEAAQAARSGVQQAQTYY